MQYPLDFYISAKTSKVKALQSPRSWPIATNDHFGSIPTRCVSLLEGRRGPTFAILLKVMTSEQHEMTASRPTTSHRRSIFSCAILLLNKATKTISIACRDEEVR